uniref:Uncharacterized protein n=1 Tax=Pyxicephalus adspersus TaxID=30357 RepID=A0AAV2ZXY2_PYXAD|nr:TPA: hypothetical protein GDO54_002503 [Pyxicephalus adspersus]
MYTIEATCRDKNIFCLPVHHKDVLCVFKTLESDVCVCMWMCMFVYGNTTPYNTCVLDLCKTIRNIIICTQVVTNKTSNVSHCQK